jgi:fibronectin-binding autotransporter adhesin
LIDAAIGRVRHRRTLPPARRKAERTLTNVIQLSSTGGYFGVAGTNDLTLNGAFNLLGSSVAQTLHIMNTATTTIGGTIQNGSGGLVKNGPGTLDVKGANTYTGATILNAGVTLVNNTTGNALTAPLP